MTYLMLITALAFINTAGFAYFLGTQEPSRIYAPKKPDRTRRPR